MYYITCQVTLALDDILCIALSVLCQYLGKKITEMYLMIHWC